MGLLGSAGDVVRGKGRSKSNASELSEAGVSGGGGGGGDGNPNDTSQLDKEEGNVLMAIIAQLRPGMDLSKIALPTFVLEPRSLLERITDFFSHPQLVFGAGDMADPKDRFMAVMTFYLSGWHIKPKGVKKPYNPVLGEFFRCSYFYEDGSEGYFIAEQVSHHPPVSAFFYISPRNGILVTGELKPKSKFLGNSAATIMEGEDRIRLLKRPEDGDYHISMPNTYARGILFGKLILELADLSSINCPKTDYHCDVDFKAKGWISGGYNVINGHVKGPGRTEVGELTGHWHSAMDFSDRKTGKKQTLFDASRAGSTPKTVIPELEQEENESRRLWSRLTEAIKTGDMHGATDAKTEVEDKQRALARQRDSAGQGIPEARFFKPAPGDKWMPKLDIDQLPQDPEEMEAMVRKWIYGSEEKAPKRGGSSGGGQQQRASVSYGSGGARGSVSAGSTSSVAPVAVPPPVHPSDASPAPSTATTPASASTTIPDDKSVQHLTNDVDHLLLEPPSVPTAPGPPAPGPKATHPI